MSIIFRNQIAILHPNSNFHLLCVNQIIQRMLQLTIFLSLMAVCTASSCNRVCGELTVPYPFGFSPSCSILLSCNSSTSFVSLSGFPLQKFTANSTFVLNISADCSRNFTLASKFFSTNYAMTRQSGLFLRECPSSDTSSCLLTTRAVSQMLHQLSSCNPKGDNLTCLFNNMAGMYFEKDDVLNKSLCHNLYTSVMYELVVGQTVLALGSLEIGWWMTGDCRCAANATCKRVNTSEAEDGYWCICDEGFIGDGYADGTGCRGGLRFHEVLAKKLFHKVIIIVSTVVALIIVIVFLIICTKIQRYGSYKKSKVQERIENIMKQNGSLAPKMYRYAGLKKITNSFSEELCKGGFGKVYKGRLKNGSLVAVKLLHNSSHTGEEFVNEVMSISRTSHVNIVALLGFCIHKSNRALIYEYVPNGSLDKYIHSENPKANLGWEKLHGIAVAIARGLEYLHRGCSTRIVHFDIKPQNILLDEDFCPKIADFGLAKLCPPKESIMSLAEMRGTIGYIAPEVFSRTFGDVSTKSDVYSYGMMVLEMVGGKRNSKLCVENSSEAYFPHWIHDRLVKGTEIELCEAMTTETKEIARKMALIGLWCTQTNPTNRPSMTRVVEMFERSPDELEMPPKPLLASPPHGMMASICSTS